MKQRSPIIAISLVAMAVLSGCAATPSTAPGGTTVPGTAVSTAPAAVSTAPAAVSTAPAAVAMVVEVYKSPDCSCCHEWEAYLRAHGYEVRSIPTADMTAVKVEHGLPPETWSCHTAIIDGYVVEGHVPVAAIEDLLESRPAIDGIALPGMPAGSPGMPGTQVAPFAVLAVTDGVTSAFGSY